METLLTEEEAKLLFASYLLKNPNDPFKAALMLCPNDTQRALWVANFWVNDKDVLAEQKRILDESGVSEDELYIETKLKEIIENCPFADDKIKALEKLMDLKGLSKKPVAVNNTNIAIVQPKAIEVPVYASLESWEAEASTQQTELLNVSRSRH